MRYLIFCLFFLSEVQANCRGFERAENFLNTRRFVDASNNHRLRNEERRRKGQAPELEERLQLANYNQARNYALRFPAIRDLGFPEISANTWQPHIKRAIGGSRAGGLRDGWKINHHGRYAVVRLDWDQNLGMHYNIELEDQRGITHKLSVEFKCNNLPCTEADYLSAMRTLNR